MANSMPTQRKKYSWKAISHILLSLWVSLSLAQGPGNRIPTVEPFVINMNPSNAPSSHSPKCPSHIAEPLVIDHLACEEEENIVGNSRNLHRSHSGDMQYESLTNSLCDRVSTDPCPAGMIARWLSRHSRSIQRNHHAHTNKNLDFNFDFGVEKDDRYLVCKPLGGIGNFIAGLLSCLAIALTTDRRLLLAPPPKTYRDNVSAYEKPISSLFDFPLNMSLRILGVEDIPFLVDADTGSGVDTTVLQV